MTTTELRIALAPTADAVECARRRLADLLASGRRSWRALTFEQNFRSP